MIYESVCLSVCLCIYVCLCLAICDHAYHLANGKCRNRMKATMQDKRISVARVKYARAL
jgi:hypothetical protein